MSIVYRPERYVVHEGAVCTGANPLHIMTGPNPWAYAVSIKPFSPLLPMEGDSEQVIKLHVSEGCIGVGILSKRGSDFFEEVEFDAADGVVECTLLVPPRGEAGSLVIRNRSRSGPAKVTVQLGELLPVAKQPNQENITLSS